MIVCDTGPLVAAALVNDDDHHACVELFTAMHLAGRSLLVPGPVVAEVGYLLGRESSRLEAMFLRSLADGDFECVDVGPEDFRRMAELVEQYEDLRSGTTDAAVIALAERRQVSEVATLATSPSSGLTMFPRLLCCPSRSPV